MNNKFFLNSIGVAVLIFAVAFLIRSIQPASATPPKPADFVTEGTDETGRYHIQFTQGFTPSGAEFYYETISDSQTGKSSVYSWNRQTQKWVDFFTDKDAMPNVIK